MKTYSIFNSVDGKFHGNWRGETPQAALEAMFSAGYGKGTYEVYEALMAEAGIDPEPVAEPKWEIVEL